MAQKISRKIGEGKQKKVLSLVLCVAMMLSVMVVGAGAAFSDQSKIKNTEAVDACTALNIIGGYPDGSFKPEGNITRAEVTKMICVALNGGKEPNLATNATPTFSDVRTNANSAWAEKYIESCYAQGIVSGVGAGKFAPAGNVTGTQLAKMLLVSLGYKSENEGFTGNAWATNVNTIASAKGLYEGLEKLDVSAALTRDSAARMIWNALQAYEVEYKTTLTTDKNGQLTSQITVQDKVVGSNNDKITLLRDKYDAWVNVGTLVGVSSNEITLTMSDADQTASDLVNYIGSGSNRQADPTIKFSKLTTDYSSLVGQRVKVLFKNGKVNDVIGVYATSDNTVYNTLMNKVELDGSKIKFDGKSYSTELLGSTSNTGARDDKNALITIKDGKLVKGYALSEFDDTADNKTSINEVTFVDTDDNGKIDTAIITTKTPAKVTYVSSTEIVAGETYKFADENISKDLAKDDYAVISENLYKDCKDIVKAEVLNTKLTGYRVKTGYVQYQMDGKWYNKAAQDTNIATGDTVKAYVYNGVVLNLDTDEGDGAIPTNIAIVVGLSQNNDTLNGDQAKIRYFNGDVKTVTISSDSSDSSLSKDDLELGSAYKVTTSGSDMKFEALKNIKYNGFYFEDNKKNAFTSDTTTNTIGGVKVDDSAVVILYNEKGSSKKITGKQYNALGNSVGQDGGSAVFTKETNGLKRVRLASVKVDNTGVSGKSSDNYAYIISDPIENENGKTAITIWTGTENKDVVVDTSYDSEDNDYTKGTLIGYSTIDDQNIINDVKVFGTIKTAKDVPGSDDSMDTSTLYKGSNQADVAKYIAVNNGKLNVTSDTTVLLVNSDADNDNEIGLKYTYGDNLPKASENGDGYLINAMWVMDEAGNDDKDIAVLVIDATGAFKGYKMDDVKAAAATKADIIKTTKGSAFEGIENYASLNAVASVDKGKIVITGTAKDIASAQNVPGFTTGDATMTSTYKGNTTDYPNVSSSDKFAIVYVKDLDLLLLVGDKEDNNSVTKVDGTNYTIDLSGLKW